MDSPTEAPPIVDAGAPEAVISDAGASDIGVEVDAGVVCPTWSPDLRDGGWDGEASVDDDSGARLPGPPATVCSCLGDTHAPLTVTNNGPFDIDMWWFDYSCGEQYFATVQGDGGTWSNNTFETHPWRIRDTFSEALLVEIPPVPEGADSSLRTITYP
jgi:hypothetical protein